MHNASQGRLPFYGTVVFFDWHGVLCRDRFWHSILGARRHPLRSALERFVDDVFTDARIVDAWMRGQLTLEDIVRRWPVSDSRWSANFLSRRAIRDCKAMRILPEMEALADAIRDSCFVAIATDNMDCFSKAARCSRRLAARFDDVICSSEVGLLKRDAPERFFSAFLEVVGGSIESSILIDDSDVNCAAFSAAGGRAILHRHPERTRAELLSMLGKHVGAVNERFGSRTIEPRIDANA